ncbi:MAG: hypothetical protein ACE5LF_07950 [Alphaproteobacteria bacterium]
MRVYFVLVPEIEDTRCRVDGAPEAPGMGRARRLMGVAVWG